MSEYFSPMAINREVLLWAVATRAQLDRWEQLSAARQRRNLGASHEFADADMWRMQYERVFCLVAARSLIDALELLDPPFTIEPVLRAEIIEARDMSQHWVENMPVFNRRPRTETPPRRSGRDFAARNPARSPYGFYSWRGDQGPMLTPNIPAADLHAVLDAVEVRIAAAQPDLLQYVPPRPESPWSEDWFPRV